MPNRLANETSPYLLQHQHNPVDWYAWGPDAFDAARRDNKPIFLSVGYSTCYWCHVMERQCFENPAIAAEMNQRFVNIKVDREERPDVDQLYMTAVQVLTRHGGWPMSVFLLPDLRPFYGGTYFPPEDAHGRPGFVTVLRAIEDAYKNRADDVSESATQLASILRQLAEPPPPQSQIQIDEDFLKQLVERSTADYDPQFGGFGSAPKFPRQTLLELLLAYNRRMAPSETRAQMLRHTLDALSLGGIRDHLGGGFHRYSTDARWLVPHFEIMLYDNAMLAWIFVEAFAQFEDRRYAGVARGVFDFVLREMTWPETGAFYTAFDAEVDAQEGLSYLWTKDQIEQILGQDDAKLFNRIYGLERGANFADPHHGTAARPDKNILFLSKPLTEEEESALAPMRQKLYEARLERKQPLLDTKIITSWNALMIRALAYGGQVLQEQRYLDAAARAADFLLQHHRTADEGLYRASRDGKARHDAFLDDYAFLIQALLALREATGQPRWKDDAAMLAMRMRDQFGDDANGGFYYTRAGARDLIVRQKVGTDSPLPSGNAVAAMALLELDEKDSARRTIEVFAGQMQQNGESMSAMAQAAIDYIVRYGGPIEVAARKTDQAADRPLSPQQVADNVVAVAARWISPLDLAIDLTILQGFHIHAHEAGQGLVATQAIVDGASEIEYPPGEALPVAFADKPVVVYSGKVTIRARLSTPPPAGATLRIGVTYQACDESICLPAVTKQTVLKR